MIAIIHYAYGAPKSIDDLSDYFSHMLNGKPVPQAILDQIKPSFLKSGFPDFIASTTERIAKGLEHILNDKSEEQVKVYTAYKHTAPFVEEAFAQALKDGATTFVTLPINAIDSESGGGAVHTEIADLIGEQSIRHIALNNWHLDDGIVELYTDRVLRALNWLPVQAQKNAHVLFTVHSQPLNTERNAPYVQQFEQLAKAIATKANVDNYHLTYRSSGGKANWLAPDVKDKIKELHAEGATGFVTCELMSLCADVESFYEIGE